MTSLSSLPHHRVEERQSWSLASLGEFSSISSLARVYHRSRSSSPEQFSQVAAAAMSSMYLANPNPSLGLPLNTRASPIACHFSSSTSPRSPFRPHFVRFSVPPPPPATNSVRFPQGLRVASLGPFPVGTGTHHRSFAAFAASSDESKLSKAEFEEDKHNAHESDKASQEAWEQVLASFKEQALKLQSVSQEAYEIYSKKAVTILNKTAEKLKIHADQARYDLDVITRELGDEGKGYLAIAAENSPEPVKDIVETFASSADDINEISQLRDFYVGIPYGVVLALGGFLNFMVTGSTSAIRFGVILGGSLLTLSVLSLKSWKKGQSSQVALKGQAVIAGILFLRNARLFCQGRTFARLVVTLISGSVAAFFAYRIADDKQLQR